MEDILNAIEELVEEARISGAHPDEPTNYREAHAALCSAIRSYGDERAKEARERCAQTVEAAAKRWPPDIAERRVLLEAVAALILDS